MIHVDAHSDTGDTYFGGQKLTHGTPFRRAIEDGVLGPKRMVQIGIRGTMYSADERQWALDQGIRIIDMEEVAERGIPYAVAEARRIVGMEPTYFTFDIDSIDPAFAPGTGTPEIGGFTAARRCSSSAASVTSTSSVRTWWKSRRRSTNPEARRSSARPSPSSCIACWPRRAASNARERCSMWLKTRIRCHSGASETRARNP
jgi:Arginase family